MAKNSISSKEYRAMMRTLCKNNSKYNAERTSFDGITFDSKAECSRYYELRRLERVGEIKNLTLQPSYLLQEGFTDNQGKNYRPIYYRGDFQYFEKSTGHIVVEDVKGVETQVFRLKEKMFRKRYSDIDLRILDSKDFG